MNDEIVERYMNGSTWRAQPESDQAKGVPQPSLADVAPEGASVLDLPAPLSVPVEDVPLTTALVSRRSVRKFAPEPLTLGELSYLLYMTQGVQEVTSRPATLRTSPSAGSRHPFETYLLVNRVQGLDPGLYKYLALDHKLTPVEISGTVTEDFVQTLAGQPASIMRDNAVTFIWVAVAYRSAWRYGRRAYRFMHLDAGHVCQNLYLAVQAVHGGCCAIGGFHDEAINARLGIDGSERFTIYAAAVGKTARS